MIDFSTANTLEELSQMWRDARADGSADMAQLNAEYTAYKKVILERNKEVGPVVNKLNPINITESVALGDKLHIFLKDDVLHYTMQVSSIAFKSASVSTTKGSFSLKIMDKGYFYNY